MDYLNRANSILTNANSMYNNTSNMFQGNALRYPPVTSQGYPLAPQQQGFLKETFYDSMTKYEWLLIILLIVFLFVMLYWVYSKRRNENLLLL